VVQEYKINSFTNTTAVIDTDTGIVVIYTGKSSTGLTPAQVKTLGGWEKIKERVADGTLTAPVSFTVPTYTTPEEDPATWRARGYDANQAAKLADWCRINKMSTSQSQINSILGIVPTPAPITVPTPEPAYVYKILPVPDPVFKGYGLDLYKQLDTALFNKNVNETKRILLEGVNVEMSPIVFLAAILLIGKIVAIIASVLGSWGFAEFLMEEAVQVTDQAIYAASQAKNWEAEAKALAKKKEILDRDAWETIIMGIPAVNVVAAAWKYFEAARMKYEIDFNLWKDKATASGVNTNVNLKKAAEAIEKGEDPAQYLPTATSEEIPEVIYGTVTGVIDGDTIDVRTMQMLTYRIRLIGIDAPENKTIEGKASTEYLTNLIAGKTVKVMVDPSNKVDQYKRVLGVVIMGTQDINLEMLKSGHAQYYVIGSSKYYSDAEYQAAVKHMGKIKITSKPSYCKIYVDSKDTGTLTTQTLDLIEGTYVIGVAKEGYRAQSKVATVEKDKTIEEHFELTASGLGEEVTVPAFTEEIKPPTEKAAFKIYITSKPTGAKLYIDGVYTKHRTPSDQKELSNVLNLLKVGEHTVRVEKAGAYAEKKIAVTEGDNGEVKLDLETIGLPVEEIPVTPEGEAVVTPKPELDVKAKISEIEKLLKELKDFIGL